MFVQKRSWMVLLFLLFEHAAGHEKGHKETACEGHSVSLSCDSGFINVIEANYGRTNRRTCSEEKPYCQISNTDCSQTTSLQTVSARCNGKKSCSVLAVNSVFSDPCFGTYKYLTVTYECQPLTQSITCEGDRSVIDCGHKSIVIQHANFGRRSLLPCPHRRASSADCYSDQTDALRSRCGGKSSCHLDASKSIYGDPCFGVYKYLEVTFTCERSWGSPKN